MPALLPAVYLAAILCNTENTESSRLACIHKTLHCAHTKSSEYKQLQSSKKQKSKMEPEKSPEFYVERCWGEETK